MCSLQWNKHERELLSSHGYSQNQLCLWKYPTMTKMAELTGHSARVLHMAQSPDGTTVVSAAADETLRFWKCFSDSDAGKAKKLGMAPPTAACSGASTSLRRQTRSGSHSRRGWWGGVLLFFSLCTNVSN